MKGYIMSIFVRNPFTLDLESHSDSHGLRCSDPSLTIQSDVAASDINQIVKQFGLTHELPYGRSVPSFDDYSDIPNDFHAAQNFILDSQNLFNEYPAEVRSRFDNDAGKFIDFLSNESNRSEATSLGFVLPSTEGLPLPNSGSSSTAESAALTPVAQSST